MELLFFDNDSNQCELNSMQQRNVRSHFRSNETQLVGCTICTNCFQQFFGSASASNRFEIVRLINDGQLLLLLIAAPIYSFDESILMTIMFR